MVARKRHSGNWLGVSYGPRAALQTEKCNRSRGRVHHELVKPRYRGLAEKLLYARSQAQRLWCEPQGRHY